MPAPSDVFAVLPLDTSSERSVAWLRLAAALGCAVGAVWLAVSGPPMQGWLCAAAGLAASLMWVGMWARTRGRARAAGSYFLALERDALRLVEGDREDRIAWREVCDVEADEERLTVRVASSNGRPLSIEPRYGGLGMYELEEAVRRAWRAAVGPAGSSTGG